MTRAEHEAIIRVAIKKGLEFDYSPEQIAKGAVDRFYLKMELEAEMSDTGSFDIETIRRPDLDKPTPVQAVPDTLPPPQPSPVSSIIIDPAAPIKAAPLRLPQGNQGSSKGITRFWKLEHLRDYLYSATQETIPVMAAGRKEPVILTRNIEVMPGIDLVKLSYGLQDAAKPSQSSPNLDGSELPAMAVDSPVFANFSCFEKEPDVEGRMSQIYQQAEVSFSPRPQHVHSVTPRRVGNLTYRLPSKNDDGDPHDEVGELPNPITGKVW